MPREIKFRGWLPSEKIMKYNDIFIRASGNPVIYEGKENIEIILMQFTGLYDRAGKEIYEGDILEHSKEENYKVVWNDGGYWWVENKDFGSDFLWRWAKVSKIIGNIYETPKLLK